MLYDEKALRKRCNKQYDDMKKRARPRLWRTGKLAGRVRRPGLEQLPFTKDQLWRLALEQVGTGVLRCPYCVEIGRGATLLDLSNFVWDHFEPEGRIGIAAHTLANLRAVCPDCNNLKGKLSYDFFVGLMAAIDRWEDPADRANIHKCLRSHGVTMRLRFPGKPKEASAPEPEVATTMPLALRDDW
jgi:5-methylcytosine-specific restriction endonuclease McrA